MIDRFTAHDIVIKLKNQHDRKLQRKMEQVS